MNAQSKCIRVFTATALQLGLLISADSPILAPVILTVDIIKPASIVAHFMALFGQMNGGLEEYGWILMLCCPPTTAQ